MEDRYSPPKDEDHDPDDVIQDVVKYVSHHRMKPEERRAKWIRDHVWAQGYSVDQSAGEIIDPNTGETVGSIPDFN